MKKLLFFLLVGFSALAQPSTGPVQYNTGSLVVSPPLLRFTFPKALADATDPLGLVTKQQLDAATNFAVGNFILSTNGTGVGLIAKQVNATNFPILVKSDYYATNHSYVIGNGYTAGGTGGSYPIAYFRPTTYGDSMPFDLMPNGTNADVWMDFCADDITPPALGGNGGSALNFLDIRQRSIANGNNAIIATDAWGSRSYGDLRLQVNGGNMLVGPYVGAMDKLYTFSKTNYFTIDHAGPLLGFFQARPATDVNLLIDAASSRVRINAVNDSNTRIPVNYNASSYNWSTDGGSTFGLMLSNSVVTTTTHTNTGNFVNGGNLVATGSATVGSLTLGGNVTASTGLVKVTTNLFATVDGYGTAYSTLPFQFRPATNVNLTWDAPSAGVLREATFNDASAAIPRRYQSSSHAFTVDDGVSYPLVLSNGVVTATTLAVTTRETVGAVVPSNRSSVATFENLMGNGANGSANFFDYGGSAGIYMGAAAGTSASPTPSTTLQVQRFAGMVLDNTAGNTNWSIAASLDLTPTGTSSTTDHGMTAAIWTTPSGSTTRSAVLTIDGSQNTTIANTTKGAFQAAGTATSCTGATIGTGSKANAGFVTATTTGVSTVVVTFPFTATTGWVICPQNNTTATMIRQTASSTTTATFSGTTVSGDIISYMAMAY